MQPAPAPDEIDFPAEARLDPGIRFPHPVSPRALDPEHAFLTGATGFTGVYLLVEILNRTRATVHCLVRAADDASARERVVRHLKNYGLWREEYAARIRAWTGDLEQPRLGLPEARFEALADELDVIYHGAGSVNMAFPYGRLKPANVNGTREVLRLAGAASTKPVHFLSSIAVFYSGAVSARGFLKESEEPAYDPTLKGGYSKSKWVADRLVAGAREHGLPAAIYRPVRIMGHSRTGAISDIGDNLPPLLKGCILLGKYPALDIEVTMVPVDYVSRAMIHLSLQEKSWSRAFHFFNPTPIAWRRLMAILQDLGYPMEEVPFDEWMDDLREHAIQSDDQPEDVTRLFAVLRLAMLAPHFLFYKRPVFDDAWTREGLAGSGIGCAPVDEALVSTYIGFWQKTGYLAAPVAQAIRG
jgi:thioester reductase-like protein